MFFPNWWWYSPWKWKFRVKNFFLWSSDQIDNLNKQTVGEVEIEVEMTLIKGKFCFVFFEIKILPGFSVYLVSFVLIILAWISFIATENISCHQYVSIFTQPGRFFFVFVFLLIIKSKTDIDLDEMLLTECFYVLTTTTLSLKYFISKGKGVFDVFDVWWSGWNDRNKKKRKLPQKKIYCRFFPVNILLRLNDF